ncbi:hypothetical protein PIB30_105043, partial [Stylosanthes scabra]|nr:hypothetical protein [Stylosanthes scabra]
MVFDRLVYSVYEVTYYSQGSDVQCNCFTFQSDGILCCHILSILMKFHLPKVSLQYILTKWSKNVSRKHTQIKYTHNVRRSDDIMNLFRGLCSHFYNVTQDFVSSVDKAAILHNTIDTRTKLKEHREYHRPISTSSERYNLVIHDECPIDIDELLRGPRRIVTRGRPVTTRLGATQDKLINRVTRKRKNVSYTE